MEFLLELLLDLILEGSIEISANHKISKFIRYPLIALIVAFFLSVILLIFIVGLASIKKYPLLGLFLVIVAVVMLVGCIIKFKKIYLRKIDKNNN